MPKNMGKRNKSTQPGRSQNRGSPGPSPLLVIAGLPETTAQAAAATIDNDDTIRWRAIAVPFSNGNDRIYAKDRAILDLGIQVCSFAMKARPGADKVPTPSRIVVAYVPAPQSERLWHVFGHAVWPLRLEHPDWSWPKGMHWRHNIETVTQLLRHAIDTADAQPARDLRLRLEARRTDDVLLLPGRNFHLDGQEQLIGRFRAFMENQLGIAQIEEGILIEKFCYERLKAFYNRVGGSGKRFAIDARGIVFAKSNVGQDGGVHEIEYEATIKACAEPDETLEVRSMLLNHTLESRYRFGTPLTPAGFQHDAQFEDGRLFDRQVFSCRTKGNINISGDHTNIFPSDVVTGNIVK